MRKRKINEQQNQGLVRHRNIIEINNKTDEKTILCIICDISINELAASIYVDNTSMCWGILSMLPALEWWKLNATVCLFGHMLFKDLNHTALLGCCRIFSLLNSGFCDLHMHGNSLNDLM